MAKMVPVTEETAELMQRIVDQGRYADGETAWADAARLLDEQAYVRDLREKLQVGIDQIERGEGIPWTPELSQQIFRRSNGTLSPGHQARSRCLPMT